MPIPKINVCMRKNYLILSMERFLIWWVSIRSRSSVAPQVCKVCRQSHPNKYRPANVAKESKMPCAEEDWKRFVRFRYCTMGLWSTSQFWECNHQRCSLPKINKYWEKDPGLFIARNSFRKNLAITFISGIGRSQYKLSLNLCWKRQGKDKSCWKGSHWCTNKHKQVNKLDSGSQWLPKHQKQWSLASLHKQDECLRFMVQIISASFRMAICGVFVAKWPGHCLECRIFELFGVSLSADHKVIEITSHTSRNHALSCNLKKNLAIETWDGSDLRDKGFLPSCFFPKHVWFSNELSATKLVCICWKHQSPKQLD